MNPCSHSEHTSRCSHSAMRWGHGFTMVEIMLVVMIIGIAAAVAIPQFIGSMRIAKMRTSARSVVMINRYARSMAILKQKRMVLRYDFTRNQMSLSSVEGRPGTGQMRSMIDSGSLFGDRSYEQDQLDESVAPTSGSEITRKLKDGVHFADFIGVDRQSHEDSSWINYYPNGMCDEHSFRLLLDDDITKEALISVEPITGDVTLELRE